MVPQAFEVNVIQMDNPASAACEPVALCSSHTVVVSLTLVSLHRAWGRRACDSSHDAADCREQGGVRAAAAAGACARADDNPAPQVRGEGSPSVPAEDASVVRRLRNKETVRSVAFIALLLLAEMRRMSEA
jgi:hypothetical protein